MRMAQGATMLYGEFTPSENLSEYTIDPGRDVNFIYIQCKSGELISGVRNIAYIGAVLHDGVINAIGMASNATGNSWGNSVYWTKSSTGQVSPITKDGTSFIFKPATFANDAKFYASRTYEWFAM